MGSFSPPAPSSQPANGADFRQVLVCFRDPHVSHAFSYFLSSLGLEPVIADCSAVPPTPYRVITEALFYPNLSEEQKARCLLVSDDPCPRETSVIVLSRPLTEEKIDAALQSWLR